MKNLWLLPLLSLLCLSCGRDKATSAAEDFYRQHADRREVTVALIDGYEKAGEVFNVVKMQAHDSATWRELLQEFDINIDINSIVSSVDTSLVSDPQPHITSLERNEFAALINDDTIVGQLGNDAVGELAHLFDSLLKARLADEHVQHSQRVRYIATYQHDSLVSEQTDTTEDADIPMTPSRSRLLQMADTHGNRGFSVISDSAEWTLWVFFYNDIEEAIRIAAKLVGFNE